MKFLLDHNMERRLAPYLRDLGHDVRVIGVDEPGDLPDEDILAIAQREGRILLTNDRDFGELAIRQGLPHAGIIYFRVRPRGFAAIRERLLTVLSDYADQLDQFLVVTATSVRVRRTR